MLCVKNIEMRVEIRRSGLRTKLSRLYSIETWQYMAHSVTGEVKG